MTTTILGANGRLGGVLYRHALRNRQVWRGQTRSKGGDIHWSGLMADKSASGIFQPSSTIINMIGSTSQNEQDLHVNNVQFVKDLLTRAAGIGVAHVVLASSAAVYGNGGDDPLTEGMPLRPLTPYGVSKAKMEAAAHAAPTGKDQPAITILRIANVAGSDALLAAAKRNVSDRKPMSLHQFPNGEAPVRSYIGPKDLFDVVNTLSKPHGGPPRTLNVAAAHPLSLDHALEGYKQFLLPTLEWKPTPVPSKVPSTVFLSTKRLERFVDPIKSDNYAFEMARQVAQDQTP